MNRVVIVVRGGVVQNVYSDNKVEIEILDYDNLEEDLLEKDLKIENMKEVY